MSGSEKGDGDGPKKRGRGPEDCLSDSEDEDFVPFTQSFSPPKPKKAYPKKSFQRGKAPKRAKCSTGKSSDPKSATTNLSKGKTLITGN